MYKLEYYTRPNGAQPVAEWLDRLDRQKSAVITAKIFKLQQAGLELIKTEMLKGIKGISGLYELRGGQCRVLVYYDKGSDGFVMLHGFLKKKAREPQEIDEGVRLLREYLANR